MSIATTPTLPRCWVDDFLRAGRIDDLTPVCTGRRESVPRVAFLLGGMVRGFEKGRMRRAFQQHVMAPLTAGPHGSSDLFVAFKLMNSSTIGRLRIGPNKVREQLVDRAALDRQLFALKPTAVHLSFEPIDEGAIAAADASRQGGGGRGAVELTGNVLLQRSESWKVCFRSLRGAVQGFVSTMRRTLLLMEAHEARTRTKYDVVVFTRPDLLYVSPLARWCDPRWAGVLQGKEMVSVNRGHMYVMPRAAASALGTLIDRSVTTVWQSCRIGQRRAARAGRTSSCGFDACPFFMTENLAELLTSTRSLVPGITLNSGDGVPGVRRAFEPALVRAFDGPETSCPSIPCSRFSVSLLSGVAAADSGAFANRREMLDDICARVALCRRRAGSFGEACKGSSPPGRQLVEDR